MTKFKSARRRKLFGPSLFWLFPLLTLIGLGLFFYQHYSKWGQQIYITFDSAQNVEPTLTKLLYRGVEVGEVEELRMSEDLKKVALSCRLLKEYESLARKNSKFTLVQPNVGFQGIEGIETLVTGPYIRVEPGGGDPASRFTGTHLSKSADTNEQQISYTLVTSHADRVSLRDPVVFRGVRIGEVTNIGFDHYGQKVQIEIKVPGRYVTFIRDNSRWWISSGISADIGLLGSKIEISSLQTLISGGIVMATPEPAGRVSKAGSQFALANEAPENWREWHTKLLLNE